MRACLVVALAIAGVGCRRHHAAQEEVEPPVAAPTSAPSAEPPPMAQPASVPSGTAAPVERMPPGGTINGDPRGPRASVFNQVVQAALPRLQACFDAVAAGLPDGQTQVSLHYFVEPPGYTGGVDASGSAPKPVLDCCRRVFEELKFPEFRGAKVEQTYPVTFVKRTGADAGAR
jgi:hypothetical protein